MLGKLNFRKGYIQGLLFALISLLVSGGITALLYPVLGPISGAIIVIPAFLTSWALGWQAGLVTSLFGIIFNGLIFVWFGKPDYVVMLINGIILMGLSVLIGWMRKVTDRERQLSQELRQKNTLLTYVLSETEEFSSALVAQTTELNKVLTASKEMTATVDFEETVYAIAKEIATSIDASGCTVSSWDKESDKIVTLIDYRIEDQDSYDNSGTEYFLNDFPSTRWVLEQGKIKTVYQNDPTSDPIEVEYLKQQNTLSFLMIPIKFRDEVIGLVEIDDIEDRKFTEEDINTVRKLVDYAGIAFHNAKIFDEIQYRLKEQTLLAKAISTVTSSLDQNVTLQFLCEQLCFALDATSAYVCTMDENTRYSTVIAEHISSKATGNEKISDLGESYLDDDLKFYELICRGLPVIEQHDSPNLGTLEQEHMWHHDAKTILYLPIKIQEKPTGFIEVWDSSHKRIFSENEINLGKALAEQTSIALENAYLHDQVTKAEAKFRSIAENSPDHILLLDKDLIIRYVNYPSQGLTVDQLLGTPLYSHVEKDQIKRVRDILQGVLETSRPNVYETMYTNPNGEIVYFESRVSPLMSDGGGTGLVVNSRDISQRKEMEKKLSYLAMHDSLTGLPNRRFLELRLNETIKLITRQKLKLELAILDLDNFKNINDQYGHTVGDQVLTELSRRIKENVRGNDFPARFGGDEFIVLFVDDQHKHENSFHERFESIFSTPILVDHHKITITASIGYKSFNGEEEIDGEKIIKLADNAMYRMKAQRNTVPEITKKADE